MQLYLVSWKFDSSEDQTFAGEALVKYIESGEVDQIIEGYERINWIHTPQDGTGIIICKAESASILYKVFAPWREKYGMKWDFKPALATEELVQLIKESK